MNTTTLPLFIPALAVILLARWIFLPEATPAKKSRVIILTLVQVALWTLLCAATALPIWLCLAGLPFMVAALLLIPNEKRHDAPALRLFLLLLACIPLYVAIILNDGKNFSEITYTYGFLSPHAPFPLWLAGALLCLKESNYAVRAFLNRLKNAPRTPQNEILPTATDNGRIIGSLERLLIYLLILNGQYLGVTAVIAIKALARFKRMESDQAFAEYVIIGTFLSLVLVCLVITALRHLALPSP